ncbi:MAG: cold shock domain-containing protein [bacterium]|nr:cold shock domain-containing protein [bacterium]
MENKLQGQVKWFNQVKGFGFITHGEQDYFVHYKVLRKVGLRSLKEGHMVLFNVMQGEKGPLAEDVELLN